MQEHIREIVERETNKYSLHWRWHDQERELDFDLEQERDFKLRLKNFPQILSTHACRIK